MGSLDKRIEHLERRLITPHKDEEAERRRAVMRDILDELARLKASRAVHYRAKRRIEPEDIPGKVLGPGYTTGQMVELAVRRVLEREHKTAPDVLSADTVEHLVQTWTGFLREVSESQGGDWSKVEDDVA